MVDAMCVDENADVIWQSGAYIRNKYIAQKIRERGKTMTFEYGRFYVRIIESKTRRVLFTSKSYRSLNKAVEAFNEAKPAVRCNGDWELVIEQGRLKKEKSRYPILMIYTKDDELNRFLGSQAIKGLERQ